MDNSLEIDERDDALVIGFGGRSRPTWYLRVLGTRLWVKIVFFGVSVAGSWVLISSWTWRLLAGAALFLYFGGLWLALGYQTAESLVSSGSLKFEGGSLTVFEEGRAIEEVPLSEVHMLQASPLMDVGQLPAETTKKLFPPPKRYELTLVTDDDMHVVARGVDKERAEAAVEKFDAYVSP